MSGGFVVGGVYLTPIVPACVIALCVTMIASAILARIGFYRLVWHRPLVEVAIFCMLFAAAATMPFIGAMI